MTDERVKCPYDTNCTMLPLRDQLEKHRHDFHSREQDNGVQYWSDHYQTLGHAPQEKAQRLIDMRKIEYSGQGTFICLPIEGYNKRVHIMRKDETGEFTCSCQGFDRNGTCSHIGALYLFFARGQRYD